MSLIEINNVTKRFDDKLVLDNINLKIEEGEIFGLLGPNGAGKSTLINILTGLIESNSGDVEIGGYTFKKDPIKVKEQIGLVPQEIALMESVTAYDNLEFFGSLYGLKGKLLKERIGEALEVAGLVDRKHDKVKKYSGGMKRRLNMAAAIMHKPRILIMDEPTVGVDPQSRNHIFEFTKKLNKENKTTVIYTSHYMEEVEYLCNNLLILDEGKEVAAGSQSRVKAMVSDKTKLVLNLKEYKAETVLKIKAIKGCIECNEENGLINLMVDEKVFEVANILKLVQEDKIKLKGINFEEPTLEEVFLSLTGKRLRD
jgi:ABC-2 type transport system ATP-binding protein